MLGANALYPETFDEKVQRHRLLLRKRSRSKSAAHCATRFAIAAERMPPTGQAYEWYVDALLNVPRTGRDVAMQLARLCGDDSQVTLPQRSLADAVGKADKAGRTRAYAERGVVALAEAGWLRVETIGRGRGASTTYYLLPGTHAERWIFRYDENERTSWQAAA